MESGQDRNIAALTLNYMCALFLRCYMQDKFINELNKLVLKASSKSEVPVAALIVKDGKIVSKAYNNRLETNNPLNHAEVNCILKAAKKLRNWRLDECDMYVTLEPCHMCREIIKECRIRNVYYYSTNNKVINHKTNFIFINNSYSMEYKEKLSTFIKNLR